MDSFRKRLEAIVGGKVTAHLFSVPLGWVVDGELLADMVRDRLAEVAAS